jgi:hypothetical protein
VPYAVGEFRAAWASFPVLIRQYRPEFNDGVVLSQVPPAADVWLTWQCDVGHVFVATPDEQRHRPGRERRRSSWCPSCAELAAPRTPSLPMAETVRLPGAGPVLGRPVPGRDPDAPSRPSRADRVVAARSAARAPGRSAARTTTSTLCAKTPTLAPGEPFASVCAPPPASAVEEQLRADLTARLEFTPGLTAVRLARPFFDHVEAWPDIVLPELRVAIEYDSTGRHGLEHVGRREAADRRKDRALRAVRWEVVRLRTGKLPALGPWDLQVGGLNRGTVPLLLDRLRAIRGDLFVDAYLRR